MIGGCVLLQYSTAPPLSQLISSLVGGLPRLKEFSSFQLYPSGAGPILLKFPFFLFLLSFVLPGFMKFLLFIRILRSLVSVEQFFFVQIVPHVNEFSM